MTAAAETLLSECRTLGRGVGQVMFRDNALSGALMLAGIAAGSPLLALYATAGTVVATLAARLVRCPETDIRAGLYGFNGTLTGLAAGVLFAPGFAQIALLVAGSALSTLVARLFARQRALPGYTAPFILVTWLLLAAFPDLHAAPEPAVAEATADWTGALARHFGQVMFQGGSPWAGVLFAAGIAVDSRRALLFALGGALLPLAAALWTDGSGAFNAGLYGYNGVLCALAFSGRTPSHALRALLSVALATALQAIGMRYGMTTLTAPFVLSVWVVGALWRPSDRNA